MERAPTRTEIVQEAYAMIFINGTLVHIKSSDLAHTLSSKGTVVPPLYENQSEYTYMRSDELTVIKTTFRPASFCFQTNSRTLNTSSLRVAGAG